MWPLSWSDTSTHRKRWTRSSPGWRQLLPEQTNKLRKVNFEFQIHLKIKFCQYRSNKLQKVTLLKLLHLNWAFNKPSAKEKKCKRPGWNILIKFQPVTLKIISVYLDSRINVCVQVSQLEEVLWRGHQKLKLGVPDAWYLSSNKDSSRQQSFFIGMCIAESSNHNGRLKDWFSKTNWSVQRN